MCLADIILNSLIVIVVGASIFYIRKVICDPVIKRRQTALANLKKVYALYEQRKRLIIISAPVSQQVPCDISPSNKPSEWQSSSITLFHSKYVLPYITILIHTGFLSSVKKLISILDEYGDCPSVVDCSNDIETSFVKKNAPASYNLLRKITLRDHSMNVARELIEIAKKRRKDYDMSIGPLLVMGLAHDIGKIPALRTGQYAMGDHPYVSFARLNSILQKDLSARAKILAAVRDHHIAEPKDKTTGKSENQATALLKEADHKARADEAGALPEISPHSSSTQLSPVYVDLAWMDKKSFIALVESRINVITNQRFEAFSMRNGMVYVRLDTISEIVRQMAKDANQTDILLSSRRNIEVSVRQILDKFIPNYIGEKYPGAKFDILDKNYRKIAVGLYMPLRVTAFSANLSELEKRKTNTLVNIGSVTPKIGVKPKKL